MIEGESPARFIVSQLTDTLARGVELARSGLPDVALLDLALPDAQGIEVFVRLHEAMPSLPESRSTPR